MLRKFFLGILGILPLLLKAQVNINAQKPPAGYVQKEQLWNMILTNTTDGFINVSIKVSLKNRATGQVVLSGQGSNISLGKEVRPISALDVEPIAYTYSSSSFQTAFLPTGNYTTCYQIILNGAGGEPFAEQCMDITADQLNPPVLSSPLDQEEIQTPYPLFNWLSATSSNVSNSVNYDLKVAAVLPGQNPADAIQNNTAVYAKNNIVQLNENYSASLKALKPDTVYAWQITARNAQNYTAKSAVWTFKVNKSSIPITPDDQSYILLDEGTTGVYQINNAPLRIKYYSFNDEYTPSIKFTDAEGTVVKTISKKIVPANNLLDFDLQSLQAGKIYNVSFTDTDSKVHNLTFSIN